MSTSFAKLQVSRTQAQALQQLENTGSAIGVDMAAILAEGPTSLFRALLANEASEKANVEDPLRVKLAQSAAFDLMLAADLSDWIDLEARGKYGLTRYPATYAAGRVTLTFGAYAIASTVAAGQFRAQTSGQFFTNVSSFAVAPNSATSIQLMALAPGVASNVPSSAAWSIVTTLASTTLTNPVVANGTWLTVVGQDEETDSNLVRRCLARLAGSSIGGAYSAFRQYVSDAFDPSINPAVPAGMVNPVTRVSTMDNCNGPGSVDVYLGTSSGGIPAAPLAIASAYLQDNCKGLGTGVLRVLSCPTQIVPVSAVIYGGTDAVQLGTTALRQLAAAIQPGGTVFYGAILAALMSVPGAYNVQISAPTAPTATQPQLGDVKLRDSCLPVFAPSLTAVP